jgi:hypothetical protein
VLLGARYAAAVGIPRLTAIEFGVAAGNGLLELERICAYYEKQSSVQFDVAGFDTGTGLPEPIDYRDVPYQWQPGWWSMDVELLKRRLQRAELILGDVADTVSLYLASLKAPIGALIFDLDYWSSTTAALKILEGEPDKHLPRVICYFDDIGVVEDVGVARAIADFNQRHEDRKIRPSLTWRHHLSAYPFGWKIYEFHHFTHPLYSNAVHGSEPKAGAIRS